MTPPTPIPFLLDPRLGIRPEALAAAWNAHPQAAAAARAQVETAPAKSFDPAAAELAALVLVPLLVGLSTNALYDLLKELLLGQPAQPSATRIQVVEIPQPDGTLVRIITLEQGGG